jgi:hypothetical protein
MRGRVFREFFEHLFDGDEVALGIAIGFVIIIVVVGLFVLKVRRDLKRDDEAQARKYGRKPPV